jgi:transposase-like protein
MHSITRRRRLQKINWALSHPPDGELRQNQQLCDTAEAWRNFHKYRNEQMNKDREVTKKKNCKPRNGLQSEQEWLSEENKRLVEENKNLKRAAVFLASRLKAKANTEY